jgi:Glucodextranase, domain B
MAEYMAFGQRGRKNGTTMMRSFLAKSSLFIILPGFLLPSCSVSENYLLHRNSPGKTATVWKTGTGTPTYKLMGTPLGSPYLVASLPSGGEIYLLSPQKDDVVDEPWVNVVGIARAETVITLNEEITVAGADGYFYARVPLEEGLNEIQCDASDMEGNEVLFSFLIVYEPGE